MNKFMEITKKVAVEGKKHSPLILTGVGVVGLIGTAYTAYKSAKKVEVITEDLEAKREVEEKVLAYETAEKQGIKLPQEDKNEYNLLLSNFEPINRYEVTRDLVGAVALPVALGLGSILCITTSYRILTNRNSILASTLALAVNEHKKYRERVVNEYGEEAEERLAVPVNRRVETFTDEEGKEKEEEVVEKASVEDLLGRWFDESEEYTDDYSYNRRFIEAAADKLETKLFREGWVTMNDMFDELGFSRTRSGAMMGWGIDNGLTISHQTTKGRDPETGFITSHLYVRWTEPKYVYDTIGLYGKSKKS